MRSVRAPSGTPVALPTIADKHGALTWLEMVSTVPSLADREAREHMEDATDSGPLYGYEFRDTYALGDPDEPKTAAQLRLRLGLKPQT